MAVEFITAFGITVPYLTSSEKVRGLRWNKTLGKYASCNASDFIGTEHEELAKTVLPKSVYAGVHDEKIFILGNTYSIKDQLKTELRKLNVGVWYGNSPTPHWCANYKSNVAKRMNELYDFNLPVNEEDTYHVSEGAVLKVWKNFIFINNYEDKKVFRQISDTLSYQVKNWEAIVMYGDVSPNWDGYVRLFNWKKKSFPIGFLHTVSKILEENKVAFKVVDNRKTSSKLNLEWNGVTLRDYQQKTIEDVVDRKMSFISSPTGTGKTEIGMGLINKLQLKTIILVHKTELLHQWADRLERTFGVPIGKIGDKNFDEKDITVAMVQTANKRLPRNKYDVIIIDEAHHTPADTFYELSRKISALYRFGLSATPFREDGDEMKFMSFLGDLYQSISIDEAVRRKFLVQPIFKSIEGSKVRHSNWQKELAGASDDEEVNRRIVNETIELMNEGHLVYVDVRLIKHGNTLTKLFIKNNIPVDFIHGKHTTEQRQEVLSKFSKGGRVLVSTLIKEGVDLPEMSAIVLAGATKSFTENLQKIGRVLRIKPNGRDNAIIIDRKDRGNYTGQWYEARTEFINRYYAMA